jgi:hypothetical protein
MRTQHRKTGPNQWSAAALSDVSLAGRTILLSSNSTKPRADATLYDTLTVYTLEAV